MNWDHISVQLRDLQKPLSVEMVSVLISIILGAKVGVGVTALLFAAFLVISTRAED